jgi:predicted tellurium resistance membrane protein TerC
VIYPLGAALVVLAYRVFQGVQENVDPDRNFMVRLVRRFYPVTGEFHGPRWFVERDGRRYATPLFLCLSAMVFADLAFAIDSIPAAFAITRDPLIIWMGNVFALLGLRALFVLVESLIARFRYLDETIAIVLGLVGLKLLVEDLVEIGPLVSLAVVTASFTIGIVASIIGDRHDPDFERHREERVESVKPEIGPEPSAPADLEERARSVTLIRKSRSRRASRANRRSRAVRHRRPRPPRRAGAGRSDHARRSPAARAR